MKYQRILLKLSGEALAGSDGHGISSAILSDFTREIKELTSLGVQLGVVIGGGNIHRGLAGAAGGMDRSVSDHMGMLATVINSIALQDSLAFVGVAKSGSSLSVVQYQGTSQKASVPISQNKVYFRIDMDFTNQTDKAYFFYSLDSLEWKTIGGTLSMRYTLGMFVGYRFGLFNYATKTAGGYVDFDWFKIGATVDQEIKLPPLVFEEIPQEPYKGVLSIPGTIEVENYDLRCKKSMRN